MIRTTFDDATYTESQYDAFSRVVEVEHVLRQEVRQEVRQTRSGQNQKVIDARQPKAGEGIRTLDIQLGKLTLCQLSYTRKSLFSHDLRHYFASKKLPKFAEN